MPTQRVTMTEAEWNAEGERLFGKDRMQWRFECPCCHHIASVEDWQKAGASEGEVAFSCVGRHSKEPRDAFAKGAGPCNYAGGGLFRLNPVTVGDHHVFAFAGEPHGN